MAEQYSDTLLRSTEFTSKTSGEEKVVTNSQAILQTEAMIQAYKEMAEQMAKQFDKAKEASKAALEVAKEIAQTSQNLDNSVKVATAKKQATKTSYQTAIDEEKAKGKDASASKIARLEAQAKKADLEQNKKFAEEMKEAYKEIGLFNKEAREELKKQEEAFYGGAAERRAVKGVEAVDKLIGGLGKLADALDSTIKTIAGYKTAWDTRLYGSDSSHTSISDVVKSTLATSPFVKQSAVMEKLNTAISEGISYNVEQRAFLGVIKDSIATTFDAFDTTLRDLVRVQQADSTAYRLGMEASLNEYLNKMFDNTEYMNSLAKTTASNLYEATSLLGAADAIGYEYQVQKWLGSLYSVGMSSGSVSAISDALGKLLSGDISGTDSGAGKLLVMAAANSGLDYAKLLTDGINDSDINLLLGSMVGYLQQIANDNKVVQNQMAGIFGLKVSDIEAAKNLSGFVDSIFESAKDYDSGSASKNLDKMLSTVYERMNLASMLDNVVDNFKYTLAEGIASSPALYGVYTVGNLLDKYVGGINIPTVSVMGNSVDLNATVADLMKVGALAGSIYKGIPAIFSGLSSMTDFSNVMNAFSKYSTSTVQIGKGFGITKSENDLSQLSLNYRANSASDDFTSANAAMAEDSKTDAKVSSKQEESDMATTDDLNDNLTNIYSLMTEIAEGSRSIHVSLDSNGMGSSSNEFLNTLLTMMKA